MLRQSISVPREELPTQTQPPRSRSRSRWLIWAGWALVALVAVAAVAFIAGYVAGIGHAAGVIRADQTTIVRLQNQLAGAQQKLSHIHQAPVAGTHFWGWWIAQAWQHLFG